MDLKVLENEKDKLRIEIGDTTFVNLLNERLWAENESAKKFEYSTFSIDHPYLSKPVLTVKGTNPEKIVLEAIDSIRKDIDILKKQVGKK